MNILEKNKNIIIENLKKVSKFSEIINITQTCSGISCNDCGFYNVYNNRISCIANLREEFKKIQRKKKLEKLLS